MVSRESIVDLFVLPTLPGGDPTGLLPLSPRWLLPAHNMAEGRKDAVVFAVPGTAFCR